MNTEVKYSKEAREVLKRGVDMVADAVKVSLGAEGRNVIIPKRSGGFDITKDGVSISKTIFPADIFEAVGASLIKEAASRTNVQAGDGTTTATVLAQAIYNGGLKLIEEGASPVELKSGIDLAVKHLVSALEGLAEPVTPENLMDVATISANGDKELGELISKAFNKIGEHGTVITQESDTADTYVELSGGTVLDRGYTHPVFATDTVKGVCEMDNPLILLHRGKMERSDKLIDLLKNLFSQRVSQNNSLLIIADDMDPFLFSNLVENSKGLGPGKICVVKTPQILKIEKDLMSDLAVLTGATIVDRLANVGISDRVLGSSKRAVVSDKDTTITGNLDNVNGLVEDLKSRIEATNNLADKKELQERLSRINGGVATLYVGAKSDSELKEKLDRVEDSINATRSALEEGIVPGAGKALIDAVLTVDRIYQGESVGSDSRNKGYALVMESVYAPFYQILINGGVTDPLVPTEFGVGIDVVTKQEVNLKGAGIIDPKKVTRCALENAASVAGTFLTTEGIVAPVDR